MIVYRIAEGLLVQPASGGPLRQIVGVAWDSLFTGSTTRELLEQRVESGEGTPVDNLDGVLSPIQQQEVWAAGVTYQRSRTARMEESASGGGSDFYDKVYNSKRPELFFKATPHRVVGHRGTMTLRSDSKWMVPEPELTLALNAAGKFIGFTVGNDLSSRDIEGENPLYLPQAKTFDGSASLGPGLYLTDKWPDPTTRIHMVIQRDHEEVYVGTTEIAQMKQTFPNLCEYLLRHCSFPEGCYLMTGTGIVPNDDFTLQAGDEVAITIEPVGTLINVMG